MLSPVLTKVSDKGEFVDLELLVFWGMGIIKGPLPNGDVSAYEVDQPAVLLVKKLNRAYPLLRKTLWQENTPCQPTFRVRHP